MKKLLVACATALLLLGLLSTFKAQKRSSELTEAAKKIELSIAEKMPGWRRESITPMQAGDVINDQVIVDQWTNGDQVVKVSVVSYESQDRADKVLKGHVNEKNKNPITDLGDEAFLLNEGKIVSFRKHNFIISVAEFGKVLPKKDSVLAKKFAHYAAKALVDVKN